MERKKEKIAAAVGILVDVIAEIVVVQRIRSLNPTVEPEEEKKNRSCSPILPCMFLTLSMLNSRVAGEQEIYTC